MLDVVVGLIDKSVICAIRDGDGMRYRLLDTVREYGLDRLRAVGDTAGPDESELRRCHAEHYLDLAERFHDSWFGPDQPQWSRRMHAELPNLRAVLAYQLADGRQPRAALALAGALYYFWYACGVAREGRYWLRRALDADAQPSPERTRALAALAWLLLVQNAPAAAAGRARECLNLADRFDLPDYRVDALQSLGLSLLYLGEPTLGMSQLERAAADAHHLDLHQPALALAQQHLAVGVMFRGETARADALLTEVLQTCRARGERWWLGRSLVVAVAAALALGDQIRAADYARETLQAAHTLGDQLSLGAGLEFAAWTAGAGHDHRCAARLLGAAGRQWRMLGGSPINAEPWRQGHTACEAAARHSLGAAAYSAEFDRGERLTLTEAVGYAIQPRVGRAEPISPAD
jgi:non-specific serine/threonine protein kinase